MATRTFSVDNDEYSRLLAQLNQGKVKAGDNATYQVITQLIAGLRKWAQFSQLTYASPTDPNVNINLGEWVNQIELVLNGLIEGTVWTEDDESATLTESRQVIAGTNVSLDYSVDNKVTINVTSSNGFAHNFLMGA